MTDYTPVPELFKSTFSQGPKFENLRGYVVKVRVRGSLAERASSMPLVNSYYLLEKMRFWQTGGTWACDMKDNHGRIEKLNPANAESNGMGDVKRWVASVWVENYMALTGSQTQKRAGIIWNRV